MAASSWKKFMAAVLITTGNENASAPAWGWATGSGSGIKSCQKWAMGLESKLLDEDASLVARCLVGDDNAWEDLVRIHSRRVYSVCYRFVGREHEAQDLMQDVFLRVFKTLATFRAGEGAFAVWLMRLTRNLLIDHYRRGRLARATDSIEDQLPVLEETAAAASPETALAGREASELLRGALARLSPELRETLILRDIEEMEYREIAQILGVPEGTVKSRLNRGRAELGRLMKRHRVAV